jgi:hypothetical protein
MDPNQPQKKKYTYQVCVEWMPEMAVASLEVHCTYHTPKFGCDMDQLTRFTKMFIQNVKEMALQELADEFVKCKMNNSNRPKLYPSNMGMSHGMDDLIWSFWLNATIIKREDAVNIIHADKLHDAMWSAICQNVLCDKIVHPPQLEGQPVADSLSPVATQHI